MSILSPQKSQKKQMDFINETMDKGAVRRLLSRVYEEFGAAKTGTLANSLKDLGFKHATLAGITISIDDLTVPDTKKALITSAEAEIDTATQRFLKGEITEVERYTKVIDTWSETTEKLTAMVIENFSRLNPVYMMAFSGARGNISQVRQLVGMRGLMADSQGQIIDLPIKSNFKEGLSVTDYIISSYGARKGLVDTALKTADSGYLTRRLVDVAQDVIITEKDCATQNGVLLQTIYEGEKEMVSLEDRIVSRAAAVDVKDSKGTLMVKAGEIINLTLAKEIKNAGIKEVLIRSALTCETAFGICQMCYGWSLTTNSIVDLGEAIGIIAAQSIGEPGTQLTMRTFHTGGAVGTMTRRDQVKAKKDGKITKIPPSRDFRTRHGDVVQITTKDGALEIETKDGTEKHNLPYNSTVFFPEAGMKVKAGDAIAEFEHGAGRGDARRLTERATKDINAASSGELYFEGFDADEKRDRQGNITRTATRPGTVWLLDGDVYNLPPGSKHLVKDNQDVKEGEIIAETLLVSEHGGEVRLPEDLTLQEIKVGKEKIRKVIDGKELTIIIASIMPSNADLQQTKKEQLWKITSGKSKESYVIKSPIGTTVENGSILAELMDETVVAPTSGEIRFEDLEIDDQRVLTKPGKIYFIPEEIHQVSKDISLKMPDIVSGTFYKAGTELVKGITSRTAGIVEITEENDIIREIIIRPGEMHRVDDISTINVDDGTVVEKGTEVAPKIKAKERCLVTINFQMDDPENEDDDDVDESELEYAEVLLRPVQEFEVAPAKVGIKFDSTEQENISVVPVTQILYNNGDRVRQIEGAPILKTSLVLQMKGYLSRLKGVVELHGAAAAPAKGKKAAADDVSNIKVVVLENLTIRREAANDLSRGGKAAIQTQLLVDDGQVIKKKTPVIKTQVLARTDGRVSLGNAAEAKDVRRVLLVTETDLRTVKVSGKAGVKAKQFVKVDDALSDKTTAPYSGYVEAVGKDSITLRSGRPYLISGGTQLQVDNRTITQRGDLMATLVFERQKTGDIVQGLPRVEELLEGRKPKDSAVISPAEGTIEIKTEDDGTTVYLVNDNGREELSVPVGSNILVENKQKIEAGTPITDGPINPHDILLISGIKAVRKYLVDEVQQVYRSQGVEIADKHIEVIVRQMSKKVRVDEGGDSTLLSGELLDEKIVQEFNRRLKEAKKDAALIEAHPVLLGITKASLNTESFISAASFQETTRVLTEAAVESKKDYLRGLKENVIIGRLIPAGTGFPNFKDERDDMFDDQLGNSKSAARKPSAILEEIESMFGSPEITEETMADFLIDDSMTITGPAGEVEETFTEEE